MCSRNGIVHPSCCLHGNHPQRRLIYGVWVASWLSSCADESSLPAEIVSGYFFTSHLHGDQFSHLDLQQLKLILEMVGTPSKDFFNPTCHFCILTQNLMTGEKFVRSLPYFRKRSFRKIFDECDDDDALDILEQLLTLEPNERIDTKQALEHPYFKKYRKNEAETENMPARRFDDEIFNESENWIEFLRQTVEITD